VYLVNEKNYGYITYEDYDVTEYETGGRRGWSPLVLLCLSSEETMQKPEFEELINWPPMKQWIMCKTRADIIPCIFWAITTLWYSIIYHLIKNYQPIAEGGIPNNMANNNKETNESFVYCSGSVFQLSGALVAMDNLLKILIIVGIIHSILIILVHVVEFIRISHHATYFGIIKNKLTSRHLFLPHVALRVFTHCAAWGILTFYVTLILGISHRGNSLFNIINFLTDVALFGYATYMFLAVRLMGYTANLIEEMFLDLLYISLI
jgi:hypothetical protein